ncbi:MAG: CapA family protein, partial [Caulobacteraceae bacterium]
FDLVSYANNHTFDFGSEGAMATNRNLSAAGLVHAGAGLNLRAARATHSFASRAGSVGLAAATSTFQTAAPANDAYGPIPAHPGVNAIRTTRVIKVDPEGLEALRKLAAASPGNTEDIGGAPGNGVRFQGMNFDAAARGAAPGYAFQMNASDEAEVIASVKEGKAKNGLMLFSLHTHEPVTDMLEPADFTVKLAHEAIDAGADGFLGHGAHQLRGIEIYKGKPIFYSLGNFAVMLPTPELNPGGFPLKVENGKVVQTTAVGGRPGTESLFTQRAYFESVIAVSRYSGGKLVEVRLHPFELAITGEPATHGLPRPVSGEAGRAIITRLQALSKPFGTTIVMDGDVGVIRVN